MAQFRALYMAAVAVVGIGVSGVIIVPRAHAHLPQQSVISDIRVEAGRYVWNATRSQLRGQLGEIFSRDSHRVQASY